MAIQDIQAKIYLEKEQIEKCKKELEDATPDRTQIYYQNRYKYILVDEYQDTNEAQYVLTKMIADKYNKAFLKLGDSRTDFLGSVGDLTAESCEAFNNEVIDSPLVYYQSTGSKINTALTSIFPLNFSHLIARYFDGPNDGLVAADAAKWGSRYIYLESSCPDGISHGDVIDLMRHDKPDFDVREFYVQLVSDLRQRGF